MQPGWLHGCVLAEQVRSQEPWQYGCRAPPQRMQGEKGTTRLDPIFSTIGEIVFLSEEAGVAVMSPLNDVQGKTSAVGCNKRSELHRMIAFGAISIAPLGPIAALVPNWKAMRVRIVDGLRPVG